MKLNVFLYLTFILGLAPVFLIAQAPVFTDCSGYNIEEDQKEDCPEAAMIFYIRDSLQLKRAWEHKGEAEVGFTISETGKVENVRILKSIDKEADAALIEVFSKMPNWIPGTENGEAVAVEVTKQITIPILENEAINQFLEHPRYVGCEDVLDDEERKTCAEREMLLFIYSGLSYPEIARENGVQGTVIIQFIINEYGTVTYPRIARDIGGGCGQAALQIVKKMPNWIPGKEFNEPVKVVYNLPVKFKLENGRK